ncbi:Vps5 C terminal like-domain-containing protein, partial [Blyttiomyces helicus]
VNQKKKEESKGGFMRVFGDAVSSASSGFVKMVEIDPKFESRRAHIDALEVQLRAILKALEAFVKQRKELGVATGEFGESMLSLSKAEANRPVAENLAIFADIQKRIQEVHDKQAKHDVTYLASTVEEYIRIVGSIKLAFNARAQSYQTHQTAVQTLQRKQEALKKQQSASKLRSDKIAAAAKEVEDAERAAAAASRDFDAVSDRLWEELGRCEREKVEAFAEGLKEFLRAGLESQRERGVVEPAENRCLPRIPELILSIPTLQIVAQWESYFSKTHTLPR